MSVPLTQASLHLAGKIQMNQISRLRLGTTLSPRSPLVWLVPALVLLASVTLSWFASEDFLGFVILMAIAGAGAALLVSNPPLALAGFLVTSLLIPIEFGTGSQSSIGLNLALLGGLVVLWLLRGATARGDNLLPDSASVIPLIGLCVVAMLAFAIGLLPWFVFASGAPLRAQIGGLATFILSAAIFLLSATQIRRLIWLKRITYLFLITGGLIVASRVIGGILGGISQLTSRGATGSLFWVWLVAIALSQGLFNSRLGRTWRVSFLALAGAVFYLNMFHGARWASGWVPPLVAVIAILLVGIPRAGMAAAFAAFVSTVANPNRVTSFVMVGDNSYSLTTRLEAWSIVGEIVRVNPLLGLGPANYYWYAPLFPILGYSVRFSSHNNYLDIVAQIGLLGLLCFLWFVVAVARVSWSLLKKMPEGFERAYVIGVLGGLAGMLVAGMLGDWIFPFVYNVGLDGMRASLLGWLFLGGVVALEQMAKRGKLELVGETSG